MGGKGGVPDFPQFLFALGQKNDLLTGMPSCPGRNLGRTIGIRGVSAVRQWDAFLQLTWWVHLSFWRDGMWFLPPTTAAEAPKPCAGFSRRARVKDAS